MRIRIATVALCWLLAPAGASAGITEVQRGANIGQASATTVTCTLNATSLTAGNVVTMQIYLGAVRTISGASDTLGNTWNVDVAGVNNGSIAHAYISSRLSAGGASTTITANVAGGNSGGADAVCIEWSSTNGWPAPYFDASTAMATGTGTTPATAGFTTAQANEIILCNLSLGNGRTITWTAPGSNVQTSPTPDSSGTRKYAYSISNPAGSNTCGGTLNSSAGWRIDAAAYRGNAGSAARRRVTVTP